MGAKSIDIGFQPFSGIMYRYTNWAKTVGQIIDPSVLTA